MTKHSLEETDGEIAVDPRVAGVSRLRLSCFRNYIELDMELGEGFNVVSGGNAQGKTNLLEALHLLGTARLLRGVRDREAILQGASVATVAGELLGQPTLIEVRIEETARKSALLNGMRLPRTADLLGRLPCVSVSSVDLALAQGEPAGRRLFLDLELCQAYPSYLRHLSLYKKSLEHRNSLLKSAREAVVDSAHFESWETHMANSGAEIRRVRGGFLESLGPLASKTHASLGGGEELGLRFAPKDAFDDAEALFRAFAQTRTDDIVRGTTTVGPHRDDFQIEVAGLDARLFASQGQQRTAVIAIKFATLLLWKEKLSRAAMLLLDDMLSDLDQSRRRRLAEWVLDNAGQAVLTCTEAEAAGKTLLERSRVFNVHAGRVEPA